ncbi:ABC transporter substrate-binding protein [Psychromonas ossibalaenae]|uniref:ABC transporter substrate-binding protein n=1 Tax=Psychromonas ossibalaenae TaxID=444922 RepID=UPI00146CDF52|nr:ABC transporter substrate-binding protein [Psychromonas ossibalaenae]
MVLILLSVSLFCSAQNKADTISSGAVNIAVDEIPVYFSPYAAAAPALQFSHLFFDPLVRWGKNQQLERRLLKKWKTVKPGITRFYLKKNIKFHSGNKLSSRDVVWTFSEINKQQKSRLFFADITSIKRVNSSAFDVYSTLSTSQLLDYLTHFFVLDSKFYSKPQHALTTRQSMLTAPAKTLSISGTGPYIIKEYNPALHLKVVRNEKYWQEEAPLAELNFIKVKSATSRLFALLADDVDISESISSESADSVEISESKLLVQAESSNALFFTMNDIRRPVFKSTNARNALHLAINQEGMLKHIIHGMGSISSIFRPLEHTENPLPNPELPGYDVKTSKSLLSKVTMPKQLSLLVMADRNGSTNEVVQALTNMMRRIGIKLNTTEVNRTEEWNRLHSSYDFSLSVWQTALMDRDNIYQNLFTESHLSVFFSERFLEAKLEGSLEKQAVFFEKMQQSHLVIPLFSKNKVWGTDRKYNLQDIFSVNGIAYWQKLQLIQ